MAVTSGCARFNVSVDFSTKHDLPIIINTFREMHQLSVDETHALIEELQVALKKVPQDP